MINNAFFIPLQEISVSISSLKYIDHGAFDGLIRLRKLDIRLHSLLKAPNLSAVGRTLRIFRLNNFEGAYENVKLKPMVALTQFGMAKAGLVDIPEDIRYVAVSLQRLILTNNGILKLDNMYDIPFPTLTVVWLQFNNISHLSHKLLLLPVLQSFMIKNNKITELPDMSSCVWGMESEGVTYSTFHPANNPFHCNGSMMWLGASLCRSGRDIYFKRLMLGIRLKDLFCHSPQEVQGRGVVPADELDIDKMERCGEFHNILSRYMSF